MIEERAVVTLIHEDAITVESVIKSSCSQCQQVDNCGNGQVAKALPQKKLSLMIPTNESFDVGDEVMIAIPEQFLLKSAWQVYIWPLIGLLSFAGAGQYFMSQQWFSHELMVIAFAAIGGYLGARAVKRWQKHTGLDNKLIPKIMQKMPKEMLVQQV